MVESSHECDRTATGGAAAIRAGLARVLSSEVFRSAPQLCAFLTYIVESKLDGRGAELKGYTIAVEALGRPADFDPQSDPIVRVEAGRLRKALGQYYAGEGAHDPVRISMPVGAYVPIFEAGEHVAAEPAPVSVAPASLDAEPAGEPHDSSAAAQNPPRTSGRRWSMMLAPVGLCLTLPLVVWLRSASGDQPVQPPPRIEQAVLVEQATRMTGVNATADLPVVAVTTSESVTDPELRAIIQAFTGPLVDAMARFDDLIAVKAPAGTIPDGVNYVFEINTSRVGNAIEGFGRLRSVKDGRIVWTTSTSRTLARGAEDPELVEIARRLAIRLAEPFGIIYADFRQVTRSPQMRCIFQALAFRRTMKPEDHLAARTCLEAIIAKDPNFHPAWSQLALVTLDEYTSGLNPLPGLPLDRALGAAMTAVRLAPSSARAQQAMMDVQFLGGSIEDALKAGREAMSRNPYDPDIMADVGARYVQLNRPAEGLPLLQRAIDLSSGRPSWYDFFAFLAADLMGAGKLADTHAAILVVDDSPFSLLGRALQYARKDDEVGLAKALKRLTQVEPLFGVDARLYLSRKGFSDPVIDRIVAHLGNKRMELIGTR